MRYCKSIWIVAVLAALSACRPAPSLSLAGSWRLKTDREDVGEARQWFASRIEGESISLPGSMLTNGLGDEITLDTPWTAGIWDSVYFKSPQYAPYRESGNIKVPFFLQPEKYYLGPDMFDVIEGALEAKAAQAQ